MTPALRFDSAALHEKGSLRLEAELSPTELGDPFGEYGELNGMQQVALDLTTEAGHVAFRGKVRGKRRLECPRCVARPLSEYEARVEGLAEGPSIPEQLLEEVRQSVVLSLPTKAYCRPDCKGLCPSCRKNLNEGPCGCKPS